MIRLLIELLLALAFWAAVGLFLFSVLVEH